MTCCSTTVPADRNPYFAVSSIHQGRHSLLLLRGELDIATVPDLDGLLRLCIELGQQRIVLDLRELRFVGAAGLTVLVEARRRLRQQGGELVVRDPSPFVARLLKLTGLASLCEAGTEALAGAGAGAGSA